MLTIKSQKGFVGVLVLFIAAAIIGYVSYKSIIQVGDNPQTEGFKKQIGKAEDLARGAAERARRIEGELSGAGGEARPVNEDKINVTLKIISENNSNKYFKKAGGGISVLDLMKLIGEEDGLNFKYQDSGLGVFIEEINGVKNNSSDNVYWMFYVNGKMAAVGASDYKLSNNDIVEWRYEGAPNLW